MCNHGVVNLGAVIKQNKVCESWAVNLLSGTNAKVERRLEEWREEEGTVMSQFNFDLFLSVT